MLDANPNLTVAQVRSILQSTAIPWGAEGQDVDYGWGRLDAYAAVKAAAGGGGGSGPAVPGHVTFTGNITSSGGKGEHTFTVSDASHPVCVTLIMPNWSGSNNPDFEKIGPRLNREGKRGPRSENRGLRWNRLLGARNWQHRPPAIGVSW